MSAWNRVTRKTHTWCNGWMRSGVIPPYPIAWRIRVQHKPSSELRYFWWGIESRDTCHTLFAYQRKEKGDSANDVLGFFGQDTDLGMRTLVVEWRWLSGPWPLPISSAVSIPMCVYHVALSTASITRRQTCFFNTPFFCEEGPQKRTHVCCLEQAHRQ